MDKMMTGALMVGMIGISATAHADTIPEAIATGLAGKGAYIARVRMTGFSAVVAGPLGRANSAAVMARRKMQTFSAADLTPAELSDDWTVIVTPTYPGLIAEDVLLLPKGSGDPSAAIRPVERVSDPVQWQNRYGATEGGAALYAVFSSESLRALPAGDISIVVVVPKGSTRGTLRANDRAQIR